MHDGYEPSVTIQSKDLEVTARLLNADIAVPTVACEFGLDLSGWYEGTSCIINCTFSPLSVTNPAVSPMAKVSAPAIQCKRYVHQMDEHVLRTPQNRSNMQHPGLTKTDTIRDILLRSLRFVKAPTGFLTLHKQLSLAVMPIQDNEPVLQ